MLSSSANYRRRWLIVLVVLLVTVLANAESNSTNAKTASVKTGAVKSWAVRWQPAQLVNGAPMVIEVEPPVRLSKLSGKWLEHQVLFIYDPSSKAWYGIAGVSLVTPPGVYALELTGTTSRAATLSFARKITVRAAKYPSIKVTVAKRFTEPSKEQLERIHQDQTVKQDVFHVTDPDREWSGKFRPPVEAPVSDVFGTRRTFNGKVQSMHQGLDYGVPTGTPVSAVNAGTVLLAGPLYFEGNCVVLDHGQGLLTLYLHLSEIKVKQGERVARGKEIALSGGTGRATGPHLHLAVRWQGVYLNPATLMTLKLP
ncbi:MAG: M23 family metallopeptidase [Terriglobales bacterium]